MTDNERWKSDGDCRFCRRYNYCSKLCTARKIRIQNSVHAAVRDAMNKATGGALDALASVAERSKG